MLFSRNLVNQTLAHMGLLQSAAVRSVPALRVWSTDNAFQGHAVTQCCFVVFCLTIRASVTREAD